MPIYKKSMVMLLIIATIVIGFAIGDDMTTTDADDLSEKYNTVQSEELSLKNKTIYVYVTGAVNKPGMVEIEGAEGTIHAADAINACGGLLPTADIENFNMAETIADGQHIRVPEKIIEQAAVLPLDNHANVSRRLSNEKNSSTNGGVVNINTANIDELDTLPGIGPAMAERIIDYRQTHGSFKSIDEIQNVRGIGQKKFDNLKNRITV